MPTLAPGTADRATCLRPIPPRAGGFTLLELLVVLVVIAIGTGLVSARLLPDEQRLLNQEAERLAQVLTIAQERADVQAQALTFQVRPDGYFFTVEALNGLRQPVRDDLLSARTWQHGAVSLRIETDGVALRELVLSPEPRTERTVIELRRERAVALIVRRYSGRFVVVRQP